MSSDVLVVATTLALYLAAVVSPGPNFALVSRLAMSGSRNAGLGAAFGLAIVATCYAALTMSGLALILDRVAWLGRAIQIAGGCYLVYLGIAAWRSSGAGDTEHSDGAAKTSLMSGLKVGLVVQSSNPKSIAFFVGLYAVAIPAGTPLWAKGAILAGGCLIELVWYGGVSIILSTGRARAIYKRFSSWIERAFGTLLAAFGIRLIAQSA